MTNCIRAFGVRVNALQPKETLQIIQNWFNNERTFHYICSTNLNNIFEANESQKYMRVMEEADLSIPDGVPLLWYGRCKGFDLRKRCGIEEIMMEVFQLSNLGYHYKHFFYGNTEEVLKDLKQSLLKRFPKLQIVGMRYPPFRPLTPEEDEQEIKLINEAQPDFLWVSLGCPKQEIWLYDHRDKLNAVVGAGAGAVFNFLSGHIPKAPNFIRYMGMEWLMRLILEPTRLYKRYLLRYPKLILYHWTKKK